MLLVVVREERRFGAAMRGVLGAWELVQLQRSPRSLEGDAGESSFSAERLRVRPGLVFF